MSMEFFLYVFHWIQRIQWQKIYDTKRTRTCHPATSCARDKHATTAPARHMWEIGSLNWAQSMLQWFISFFEFTEFSKSSAPFRKNSNGPVTAHSVTDIDLVQNRPIQLVFCSLIDIDMGHLYWHMAAALVTLTHFILTNFIYQFWCTIKFNTIT